MQSEGRSDVIASSASPIDVVFDLSFVWHQQATSSDIEIWNKRRCVHVISMWDQVDWLHRLAALEHYYRPTVPTGKIASKRPSRKPPHPHRPPSQAAPSCP